MRLIDYIEINSGGSLKRIEFLHGDLTNILEEHAVDVLVVSAFPNDYAPTSGSLVGALHRKGTSVAELAVSKEVDLRHAFSCWLSREIQNPRPGLEFKRILCFEPASRGSPPELVGDIFRALSPFLGGKPSISTVAMPVVAAGDQGYSVATMLPPLVEAAYHWMSIGLPLRILKIVAHGSESAAEGGRIFKKLKEQYHPNDEKRGSPPEFDVFVSYSRKDQVAASRVAASLSANYSVFLDIQSIDIGAAWQQRMFAALDSCRKIVALYSPDYVASKVCQEEFNIAWARSRKLSKNLIIPIYWVSADLPTYMEMLNYVDCREAQGHKLEEACSQMVIAG